MGNLQYWRVVVTLRTRLRLEESRLLNWGEQVGLLEDILSDNSKTLNLQHNLVLEVLLEMHVAFRACLKTTSKFDLQVSSDLVLPSAASKKQRDFISKARSIWKGGIGTRLQWAMIRREEFGTLVDRLKGFSDHMESLLDRHSLRELHSMQTKSNLLLLQLTEQVTQLHVLAQNFNHKPTTSAWTLSRSTTLSSEVIEDDDFSRLINFKAQNLAMNEDDHDVDLFIPTATLTWQGEVSFLDRTVAHLNGSPVWIEWRQTSDRLDDTYRDIVTSRMSKLAYLLGDDKPPAGFRTPRCLGYCHMEADEEAYGLVYEDSLKSSPQTAPRSLRDLFAERSTPSLSARMSLALQLTESLMYLHAVNWLHKGFSSANILFPQSSAAKTGRLEDPTISGFDFSRPDADETTIKSITRAQDDYYKSPALLQGHSSTKADDIYALGVVLIEIALWKPVEDIVEGSTGKKLSRSQIYFIRERLLSEGIEKHQGILDDVAAAAGDRYASVARRCRQGAEELGLPTDRSKARGPEVDSSLQAVFYDEIIHGFEGSPGVVCIELGLSYTVVERQIDVNDHYVVSYSFDKSTGH